MKAAIYQGKHRFEVKDVPDPQPGPGQIQVRITYAGVCGTDVHGFQYDNVPPGTILGHEYAGVVSAVGKGVTRWRIGDRVVGGGGTPPPGGGHPAYFSPRFTFSKEGWKVSKPGAYAEKLLMEEWEPLPVPANVSDLEAALCEPAANAARAVRRSGLRTGDSVAVLGAGPIGLFTLQVLKASGAGKVIVSEPSPARAAAAAKLGADAVIDPTKEDAVQRIVALTDGNGPHIAFDCAAAPQSLQQALDCVRRNGRVVLIALAWEPVSVFTVDWICREVELVTTLGAQDEDFKATLGLIASRKITMEPLVTDASIQPLDRIQTTFEELMKPRNRVQAVFKL